MNNKEIPNITLQFGGIIVKHYSETTALHIQRRATKQGTVRDRREKKRQGSADFWFSTIFLFNLHLVK